MAVRWRHWCRNGCGKTVTYLGTKEGYQCEECLQYFTKKELEEVMK